MIEWTGLDIYKILDMNIIEFLNLTVFNMDYNDWKEQQIKKVTRK